MTRAQLRWLSTFLYHVRSYSNPGTPVLYVPQDAPGYIGVMFMLDGERVGSAFEMPFFRA